MWGGACASVIQLVSAAAVAIYALAMQRKAETGKVGSGTREPMKMGAMGGSRQEEKEGARERRKEL